VSIVEGSIARRILANCPKASFMPSCLPARQLRSLITRIEQKAHRERGFFGKGIQQKSAKVFIDMVGNRGSGEKSFGFQTKSSGLNIISRGSNLPFSSRRLLCQKADNKKRVLRFRKGQARLKKFSWLGSMHPLRQRTAIIPQIADPTRVNFSLGIQKPSLACTRRRNIFQFHFIAPEIWSRLDLKISESLLHLGGRLAETCSAS